ncbi:MAG TPA: histidinol-phosphatase [Candidatus Methylomirabilis sp.]|nr:histidinol-phosphatase [Candidatus Methylomirabilis sp.]
MTATPTLDELLDLALAAARESGEVALRYFTRDVQVEVKSDQTPVTVADREGERLLRAKIEGRFPGHGIVGEEFGVVREHAPYRWILDPIDGTQSFIHGVPLWGVMVGVEKNQEPVLGVVHFPALKETVWARVGGGAWWNGKRASVSRVARLEEAALLTTDLRLFVDQRLRAAFDRLRARVKFDRTWGDCYGHALVATGRADIMLDPIMNEWDTCALLPILEEAGGRFSDWQGARTIRGGNAISTNGLLFDAVINVVRGEGRETKD